MKTKSTIVPAFFSLVAFILILLALLAGTSPGPLQGLDIVTFNTSGLGKNLIGGDRTEEPTPTTTTDNGACDFLGRFAEDCASATAAVGDKKDDIIDKINDIGNDISDELAERLGIEEFYSIHPTTICFGDFTPNATHGMASRSVKECHKVFPNGYNVSAFLDHDLQVGPFKATLADLGFSDKLQGAVNKLNSVIKAFVALLIIATIFTGLSFPASVVSYFVPPRRDKLAIKLNICISTLAFVFLLVTSVVVTYIAYAGLDEVNDMGGDIGLNAQAGTAYTVVTWVATGLMLFVLGHWIWVFLRFRNGKMRFKDLEHSGDRSPEGHYREKPSRKSVLSGWGGKRARRL